MLHHNRLHTIWPRTFVALRSLRRLTLASNQLTSLPEAVLRHVTALRHLDLADNHFRSLHRCAFPVSTTSLRTLSVVGNPVTCNCSLAWLGADPWLCTDPWLDADPWLDVDPWLGVDPRLGADSGRDVSGQFRFYIVRRFYNPNPLTRTFGLSSSQRMDLSLIHI